MLAMISQYSTRAVRVVGCVRIGISCNLLYSTTVVLGGFLTCVVDALLGPRDGNGMAVLDALLSCTLLEHGAASCRVAVALRGA